MLYWLLYSLEPNFSALNVFRYITFRSGMAALTAYVFVILAGRPFIELIRRKQYGQAVRDDGPQTHLKKKGTPTMGGILIVTGLSLGTLLWSDLRNPHIWFLLLITWAYAAIGFLDDYFKVLRKDPKGLASRWKFRLQVISALVVAVGLYKAQLGWVGQGKLYFPFFKNLSLDMGPWYMAFTVLVIVGASNAVNLTDGLDGLAIGPCIVNGACFFVLTYLAGNSVFANYLQIPHVPGIGELGVYCASLVAAGVAFLWYNTYPAQIFMGDVGALSLGGALGALAVASKNEILFVILGGVFVLETISVILQVASFKIFGRRIFKMAPIHHHFELIGWPEPKVIVRFWIVSFILGILALSTLKLR
ncbi:MAG: phospho-N-acetylmuramoyl-pentapeptide-transferase [Bdellovibrionales bacterium]|nr:phospho-N-acetylmuramoyl-pentapeptide-transferase [Bdellovibrionales bacterium]